MTWRTRVAVALLGLSTSLGCSGSGETGAGSGDKGNQPGDGSTGGGTSADSGNGTGNGGGTGAAGFAGGSAGGEGGAAGGGGAAASAGTAGADSGASTGNGGNGGGNGQGGGANGGGANGGGANGGGANGGGANGGGTNADASVGGGSGGPNDGGSTAKCAKSTDCDDHDACNGTETCLEGICMEGVALDCDDKNKCTADACDAASGCTHSPLSGDTCDDGSACTTSDTCQNGTCVGTGQLPCDDQNGCTDDTCDPGNGCVYTNNTAACDDGSACTTGDVCGSGACTGAAITCNDGNPCTSDSCDVTKGCQTAPASGASCDDGDPCTTGDLCQSGACVGAAATVCNDGNPCTTDSCDSAVGCVATNNTVACDDGNPCTSGDVCASGSCAGTAVSCDDGNECTTDSCGANGTCVHQALTDGTSCANDGNPCTVDTCQSGACHTPVPAGTVQCRAPSCSGTPPSSTAAGFCDATGTCPNAVVTSCGTDPCNAAGTACQNSCALDADCPGGFFCNASGKCVTKVPNGTPCTRSAQCSQSNCVDGFCCNSACGGGSTTDCQACNVTPGTCTPLSGTSCSDGNACTSGDTCSAGTCGAGPAPNCDDGNPCTADACDAQKGCTHTAVANGTACSDGNACTSGDTCSSGVCNGGPATSCDDTNPCTSDTCAPATGCVHTNNTLPCSDGNACTSGDVCSGGACKAGAALTCTDGNPCTNDTCAPATGCVFTNNTVACSDGNPCTSGDTCSNGACTGGGATNCDDSNPCTDDVCFTGSGCLHNNNANPCNDANACTTGDTCANGACKGINPLVCNDGNLCTTDTCAPATGCVFTNNTVPCDDGNACTTTDVCGGGACKPGPAKNCSDGNVCTTDTCNASTGCVYTNNTVACTDGNACTLSDTCANGVCVGTPTGCDDGNPCTNDSCNTSTGCAHTPNGIACDDGNACTTGDTCSGGVCVGTAKSCDDGVFCNGAETCNSVTGCLAGTPVNCPNADGFDCTVEFCSETQKGCATVPQDTKCDDAKFCNGGEQCKPSDPKHDVKGCVAGTAPTCSDGISCTTDSCDDFAGACKFAPVDSKCSDSNVCNGIETCDTSLGCVAGTPLSCSDGKTCTVDSCNAATGCVYTPSNALCQNGLYCDGAEVCNPGAGGANPATGCIAGTAVTCPPTDAVACTLDVCDEPTDSCKVFFDNSLCGGLTCTALGCGKSCTTNANCTDGLACNGVETCDLSGGSPGQCKPGTPVNCDDGKSCTVDACLDPAGTCSHAANNAACVDGNLCNGTETCAPGVGADPITGCKAGTVLNCDDGIVCTDDVCDPSTGCKHAADSGFCDDGKVCNGAETCAPSSVSPVPDFKGCIPGTTMVCPSDGIACTTDTCSETAGGCVNLADNSTCPCGQTCDPQTGCGHHCVVSTCQGKTYQCGDCLDNDGDCGVDSLSDPECLGPCSDSETGFKGEIPGQDHGNCDADCYFDQDNGSGNDQCFWSEQCDPRSLSSANPAYTPSLSNKCDYSKLNASGLTQCSGWNAAQTLKCWDPAGAPGNNYCGGLVPNGCDCFGCCVIPGAPTPVFLGSAPASNQPGTCTEGAALANPALCHPCTQVASCTKTCGHCQICIGKPTLPADCECQECPAGAQMCGAPCGSACPAGQFCLSGCCSLNP